MKALVTVYRTQLLPKSAKRRYRILINSLSKKDLHNFDQWLTDSIDNLDNELARKLQREIAGFLS